MYNDFHREQHELHGQNETHFFAITLAMMPYSVITSTHSTLCYQCMVGVFTIGEIIYKHKCMGGNIRINPKKGGWVLDP